MEVTSSSVTMPTRPGKSAQAVGQMAKVAVAEAKAAGVDLPKNAQGMAASAIAQGADPSSVFAALTTPDPIADDFASGDDPTVPVDDLSPEGPETIEDPTASAAEEGYAAAGDATGANLVLDEAEVALELLKGAA